MSITYAMIIMFGSMGDHLLIWQDIEELDLADDLISGSTMDIIRRTIL